MQIALQVSVWDISTVANSHPSQLQPLSTTAVPAGDIQTCIGWNQQDSTELVTNGPRRVFFWRQRQAADQQLSYYSPALRPAEFQQAVGDFVASTFVPGTTQVNVPIRCCSWCSTVQLLCNSRTSSIACVAPPC